MYIFIPVLVYFILVRLFRQSRAGRRDSLLCEATLWGLALSIITETLSVPRPLSFNSR